MSGTRRDFLRQVAQAGGYRATYLTMQAMGLLGTAAVAEPLALEPAPSRNQSGRSRRRGRRALRGLRARQGRIRLHGARSPRSRRRPQLDRPARRQARHDRRLAPGLRVRRGALLERGRGAASQPSSGHARLLPRARRRARGRGQYQPRRIAAQSVGERRQADRAAPGVNDTRGEISELLGKAINRGALDQELSPHDKERMLAFLRHYGDLSPDLRLRRVDPRGLQDLAGAGRRGRREARSGAPGRAARRRHVDRHAVRGEFHPAGHHVSAGRRHGPHCGGVCGEARPRRASRQRGHCHPAHRQRRRAYLPSTSGPASATRSTLPIAS